jgi:hypothetical protein
MSILQGGVRNEGIFSQGGPRMSSHINLLYETGSTSTFSIPILILVMNGR